MDHRVISFLVMTKSSPVNTGRGNLSELNCSITAYNFQTIYFHLNTKTFTAIAIKNERMKKRGGLFNYEIVKFNIQFN